MGARLNKNLDHDKQPPLSDAYDESSMHQIIVKFIARMSKGVQTYLELECTLYIYGYSNKLDNFFKFIRKQNFNLNMLLNHSLRDPILCIHNKSNLVPSPVRVHLPQRLPPGAQGPYIPVGGRELWSHQGIPDVVEPKET